jgi:hypothetical protein
MWRGSPNRVPAPAAEAPGVSPASLDLFLMGFSPGSLGHTKRRGHWDRAGCDTDENYSAATLHLSLSPRTSLTTAFAGSPW